MEKEKKLQRWKNTHFPKLIHTFSPRHQTILNIAKPQTKYGTKLLATFDDYKKSIFLHGIEGSGKTIEAVLCMLNVIRIGYLSGNNLTAKFISTIDLLRELREIYNNNGSETAIIKKYRDYDILVLDDFGTEKITDWAYSMLYSIINYRYEWYKTTIYTSNFDLEQISKNLNDARITSRIADECIIIEMTKQFRNS